MRNVITIARKELGIYFTTVVGYSCFGAYTFVLGLIFISRLNVFQTTYTSFYGRQQFDALSQLNFNDLIIAPVYGTGMWMFLFFVPFLTMRLFAEEKQSRTFELLMTAPITSFEMVIGKFLGVGFMMLVMAGIPLIFPAILQVYGSSSGPSSPVEWAPVFSSSMTLLLVGVTFCAVGLLVSALSESQIVAALLTFAALLLAFVLPLIAGGLEGDWRSVIEYVGPMAHIGRGLRGRVLLADLVYFGSATLTFLYLTYRVVESHRWR